jgi:hypothetical protein
LPGSSGRASRPELRDGLDALCVEEGAGSEALRAASIQLARNRTWRLLEPSLRAGVCPPAAFPVKIGRSFAKEELVGIKRLCLGLVLPFLLLPVDAWGEVKVVRRADGTLLMFNEPGSSRPAEGGTTPRLRPAPQPQWTEWISSHAAEQGLDSRLVQAVIQVESAYDPRAVSRKGAQGLMQLMPTTAHLLQVDDPFDPQENIRGGARYLRLMLDLFEGSLELALAAYNAGPGAVQRYGGVPPFDETREYVRRVLTLYRGAPQELPRAAARPSQEIRVHRESGGHLVMATAAGGG